MSASTDIRNASQNLYQTLSVSDRWLITFVVMSATLMQVIDTTIVNVALPHMQGSLGASSTEVTWTLTSYLIASAIFMPLTGYLVDVLGRKRYLILSIVGFTLTSALCGAANSLNQLILFRCLQGIFGSGLVSLSQAILSDIFPPKERGKAMAIWGIGVMVGPILGPTLGGYLTEIASWRWTFYVNVPVGILTLLLVDVVPDTTRKQRLMDWTGLFFLSLAIGSLQFVLDRGNQEDWFNSSLICVMTYLIIVGLFGFIMHRSSNTRNVFDIKIFKDKNFSLASILLCIFGLGLYGMMVIQPIMLEGLYDYPALTTGLMIAPRGISGMVSMIIIGKLISYVDAKWLIVAGVLITIVGLEFCTNFSTNHISPEWLIGPMIIQGFGLGMIFVPLSTIAYSTLPAHLRTEAAGLYSLLRTIGSSMGISFAITLYTRRSQFFWHELGGAMNPYNNSLNNFFNPLHLNQQPHLSMALLAKLVEQQATMLSFINVFAFIMWCFILMLPLILLLSSNKKY